MRMPRTVLVRYLYAAALALLIAAPLYGGDLEIGWIQRLPSIDYVWDSSDPAREGWPVENTTVTWVATVKNWSGHDKTNVGFDWSVDGVTVEEGAIDVEAGASIEVSLPRAWTFDREELTLSIDGHQLTVFTDAITVGFYVEQSFYDFFWQQLPLKIASVTSFEGWMQLLVDIFNDAAAIAFYPETPDGVLDRLRVDRITIVPDGSLPMAGVPPGWELESRSTQAGRFPNMADRTVDLQWGFSSELVGWFPRENTDLFLESAALHELGHARYLVDLYGWNVGEINGDVLEMTPPPPTIHGEAHYATERGWMNQQYTFIDRYSAAALNRIAGFRARVGNYNPPENIGEFLNDLPNENRVRIVDSAGNPIRDAAVRLYRAVPVASDSHYVRHFDGIPEQNLKTDGDGVIVLPRNPFSEGPIVHDHESGSNTIVVVQVDQLGTVLYGYLESFRFNLAYWGGQTESADYDLVVGRKICSSSEQPWVVTPRYEVVSNTGDVRLEWLNINGFRVAGAHFEVWASVDNRKPVLLGSTAVSRLNVSLPPGEIQWWVIGSRPGCAESRSNTGRFSIEIPTFPRRRAVSR